MKSLFPSNALRRQGLPTALTRKCSCVAGRMAAAMYLLAFLNVYVFGVMEFGVVMGFLFGWIPAAVIGFFSARLTHAWLDSLLLDIVTLQRRWHAQ